MYPAYLTSPVVVENYWNIAFRLTVWKPKTPAQDSSVRESDHGDYFPKGSLTCFLAFSDINNNYKNIKMNTVQL